MQFSILTFPSTRGPRGLFEAEMQPFFLTVHTIRSPEGWVSLSGTPIRQTVSAWVG